ncbi:MAG: hypothetical protein KDA90_23050, partial [Planctomycetaceae bacterium]|nr:hypothetical protein [Planctomycetaceae bacterium]
IEWQLIDVKLLVPTERRLVFSEVYGRIPFEYEKSFRSSLRVLQSLGASPTTPLGSPHLLGKVSINVASAFLLDGVEVD